MTTKGYNNRAIQAVVKLGGSLLAKEAEARAAVDSLTECAEAGLRLVVVPGGGPTDNTIEALDRRHPFAPDTHHRACARAQDQTGLMIADPTFGDALVACETIEEVGKALDRGRVPVLLPSPIIFLLDPFERTWQITSDGMAAWFAWLLGAPQLVVLTNVDGVYPPSSDFEGAPIPDVAATELEAWGRTAVDECTPPFLRAHRIGCWVLNGGVRGRLLAALSGKKPIGTYIRPE